MRLTLEMLTASFLLTVAACGSSDAAVADGGSNDASAFDGGVVTDDAGTAADAGPEASDAGPSECTLDTDCPGDGMCGAGRCAGYICHLGPAVCSDPRPMCPGGQAAPREAGCWGECVDASRCVWVRHPVVCSPDDHFVWSLDGGYRCAPLPEPCIGADACDLCTLVGSRCKSCSTSRDSGGRWIIACDTGR